MAWSVCLSVWVCVCLLVLSSALQKMAKLTEILFGGLTRLGQRNHVLDGGPDPPGNGAILGVVRSTEKHCHCCTDCCKKSITASQPHCCSRLQCCWLVSITLHFLPVKNSPPWCGLSSKFFYYLLVLNTQVSELIINTYSHIHPQRFNYKRVKCTQLYSDSKNITELLQKLFLFFFQSEVITISGSDKYMLLTIFPAVLCISWWHDNAGIRQWATPLCGLWVSVTQLLLHTRHCRASTFTANVNVIPSF